MHVAPFEIRSFLGVNGDSSPTGRGAASGNGRHAKFPRTQWLRCLLLSVCGLAVLVFGLNLIESSRIPSMPSLEQGESKWEKGDGPSEPGGQGQDSTATTNQLDSTSSVVTNSPAESPIAQGTRLPTPALRPGIPDSSGQLLPPQGGGIPMPNTVSNPPLSNNSDVNISNNDSVETPAEQPIPYQQSNNIPIVDINYTYPEATHPVMGDAAKNFVDRWCDLDGKEWYPTGDSSWKLRAPAILMPGAKSSGLSVLADLLNQHPQVIPPSSGPATEQFFFDGNFRKYVRTNQRTTVMQARARLVALNYPEMDFRKNPGSISYHASPGYLFRSNVLPRRLFCVLPWIKMVVLLREPIERLYQHYLTTRGEHRLPHALDEWIEVDFDLMRESGLIANATNPTAKHNMTDEDVAWYQYQHSSVQGPVGRSLYEIQLRQWFQGLQAIGRDPKDSVLIVRTEELAENPEREYKRILKFLELTDYKPPSMEKVSALATQQSSEMSAATRKRLEDFFKPYNLRLQKLLRSYKIPYGSGGTKKTTGEK